MEASSLKKKFDNWMCRKRHFNRPGLVQEPGVRSRRPAGMPVSPTVTIYRLLVFALVALGPAGCAWLIAPPQDDPAARQVVESVQTANGGVERFKGLARVRIESSRRNVSGRVAIAAKLPDKIRIEWLSAMGQPLTSVAGDGTHITMLTSGSDRLYRIRQSRGALETVMHIPLGVDEMLGIIAARPWLPRHAAALLTDVDGTRATVELVNRFHGMVARLTVELDQNRPERLQIYDGAGNRRYGVQWSQWSQFGAVATAKKVVVTASNDDRLEITMDRFWPHADLDDRLFSLAPREG